MSSPSVVIALAGGVGAAVGAGVGQFVQWWRETVRTTIEDRRRREDREDSLARERRASQRQAYDQVATLLEEIIVAAQTARRSHEWSRQRPGFLSPKHLSTMEASYQKFYSVLSERATAIRRQLVTAASAELMPLRTFLLIADNLWQEVHVEAQWSIEKPEQHMAHFDYKDGMLLKGWKAMPSETAPDIYLENLRVTEQFCVWGFRRIQFELAGAPNPGPPPEVVPEPGEPIQSY